MQEYRCVDSVSMTRAGSGETRSGRVFQEMNEYRLLVQPGVDICAQIKAEKQYLCDEFPDFNHGGAPEIVLGIFLAKESMEETLIRWIQRVCMRLYDFVITLNNYSSYPSDTIYLRVQDHEPFLEMAKQLNVIDEYLKSCGSPGVKWNKRPHISIGCRLTKEQYE